MRRVLVSWSSGKDAAWALETIRSKSAVEIVGLLTTVAEDDGRVAMHGTPREVLEAQSRALDLPLVTVELPWPASNERYEAAVRDVLLTVAGEGVSHVVFGDLFLSDVRRYREELVVGTGVEAMFPLWGRSTESLAREMLQGGLEAHVTTVDLATLSEAFCGAPFDADFLGRLPSGIDPCGERGEFHTVVARSPSFRWSLPILLEDRVSRDGFAFCVPSLSGTDC